MSPYRVLVQDNNDEIIPLAAMLSTNTRTKHKTVYIMERVMPALLPHVEQDCVDALYDTNTRLNSVILHAYAVHKDANSRLYLLEENSSFDSDRHTHHWIQEEFRLLSECQRAAMNDYIKMKGWKLIRIV